MLRLILFLVPILFLASCSSDPPSTSEEFVQQGDRQIRSGDLLAAIGSYRMALHRDSLNPVIIGRLSRAYEMRGLTVPASKYARWTANLFYEKGATVLHAGDQSAALTAFEQTLEYFPEHPLALNRMGEIHLARGENDRALSFFGRSAEANPQFAETYIRLGDLHRSNGDLDKAKQAFGKAIEANINASQAYLGLGQISLQEEDWANAADAFKKALMVRPDSPSAQAGLAQARRHL
jgi:tetratricopeptide (TPR) repeat protein